jgi:hypothetical protein
MRLQRIIALLALLATGIPVAARADAFYHYAGQPFDSALGRYTTSDSLTGTIQVSAVLGPNLSNAAIALVSFSFDDQLKVFTPANSTPETPRVTTDAGGQIVNWSFDFSDASGEIMGTFNNGPADEIDQASDFSGGNSLASNMNAPGSWTLLPEPPTLLLGLLGSLGALARRSARRPNLV